jgi:hypothetical protein
MAKEKKHVAATLKNILDNPTMQFITDRSLPLDDVVELVQKYWTVDMYTRKPGPALINGIFEGTDLDLAVFLSGLADRGAVLNLPRYKSMRPTTLREGERLSSKENRHGKIMGLVSNKEVFSFSLRIMDMNVMTTEAVGEPRTFSVTTPDGNWYDGWDRIEWDPSANENKFLTENDIWTGNRVIFKHFVHPNRWISIYGQHYFMTKSLIERLTEQAADNFKQMKKMQTEGIMYPVTGELGSPKVWPKSSKEEGKSVKFETLEAEVDFPMSNEYPKLESTQENLVKLTDQRRYWNSTVIPNLRFQTRITEYAFYKFGIKKEGGEKMPAWLSGGTEWQRDFKFPRKQIKWDRIKLMQPGVGEFSVSIRKRIKTKSEIMAKDFIGGI